MIGVIHCEYPKSPVLNLKQTQISVFKPLPEGIIESNSGAGIIRS